MEQRLSNVMCIRLLEAGGGGGGAMPHCHRKEGTLSVHHGRRLERREGVQNCEDPPAKAHGERTRCTAWPGTHWRGGTNCSGTLMVLPLPSS